MRLSAWFEHLTFGRALVCKTAPSFVISGLWPVGAGHTFWPVSKTGFVFLDSQKMEMIHYRFI